MAYYELQGDRIIVPDDREVIWRYLTFEKFKDLIATRTLYFSKAKIFGEYNEGLLSFYDKETIRRENISFFKDKWKAKYDDQIQSYERLKEVTYLNCWVASNIESAHMWREYINSDDGVAIRTTVKRLKDAFRKTTFEQMIFLSKVHYFDPISEPLGVFNMVRLFSRKITSYSAEREIRGIIMLDNFNSIPESIRVPINLLELVEEIIFSPKASTEFKGQTRDFLAGTSFHQLVRDSNIRAV